MDKVIFSLEISDSKEHRYASLALPATDYEMLDVLDKFGVQDETPLRWQVEAHQRFGCLVPFLDGSGSLNDLNHLARELAQMDQDIGIAFEGLLRVENEKKEPFGLPTLIDLAHNANRGVCYVQPVRSDQELGEFYVDNDLLPELAALPDDIIKLLDYGKIGREQREGECGVYVPQRWDSPGGYVTQHTEMESIYDSLPHAPQKPAAAIILQLEHDLFQTRLELPADSQAMDAALDAIAAGGWDDAIHIRCLDCAAPALISSIGDDDNIAHINRLAQTLAEMDPPQLTKFKAVLAATEDLSVLGATHIAHNLDEYLFTPQYTSPEDMARDFLLSSLGEPAMATLSKYVNLYGYGEKLMEEQQCGLTEYGMVSREDGQCLKTSLSPTASIQGGMEMM